MTRTTAASAIGLPTALVLSFLSLACTDLDSGYTRDGDGLYLDGCGYCAEHLAEGAAKARCTAHNREKNERDGAAFLSLQPWLRLPQNPTDYRFERVDSDGAPASFPVKAEVPRATTLLADRSLRKLTADEWRRFSGGVSPPPGKQLLLVRAVFCDDVQRSQFRLSRRGAEYLIEGVAYFMGSGSCGLPTPYAVPRLAALETLPEELYVDCHDDWTE